MGHTEVVDILVKAGADVNQPCTKVANHVHQTNFCLRLNMTTFIFIVVDYSPLHRHNTVVFWGKPLGMDIPI